MDSRMKLDLFHIDCIGADCLRHFDSLAENAGSVGCDIAVKLGLERFDHVIVRAETAGSDDHSLCVDCDGIAGSAFGSDACRFSFVYENFFRGCAEENFDTALIDILFQNRNSPRCIL